MVEINRVWLNVDTDTNKITLFSRPRVSIHVDAYIWSLIEEHIVKPHMNERLFRTQFNQMETTEKQALMESLATRYALCGQRQELPLP